MKDDDIVYSFTLGDAPKKYVDNKNVDPKYKAPKDGFIRIMIEKNHRGGKSVSVLYGFENNIDLESICSDLKKKCGAGGTIKENRIEIQGDKRDIIENYLTAKGFKVKKVGG